MNIFMFLLILYATPVQGAILDPTAPKGDQSTFMEDDHLPIPQPQIATLGSEQDAKNTNANWSLDDDMLSEEPRIATSGTRQDPSDFSISQGLGSVGQNLQNAHASTARHNQAPLRSIYARPQYSYGTALCIGGLSFLTVYSYFRLIMNAVERTTRSEQLKVQNLPKAVAWVHQEMARHGVDENNYLLRANHMFHEWIVPIQIQHPYLISVSTVDMQEIENILANHADSPQLDRYRCALHIVCSQLSLRFISQQHANVKSNITWGSALCASLIVSFCFLIEKDFAETNSFDNAVHALLPCATLYKFYRSIRTYNATEATNVNQAIDTLPDTLVPACIQLFEEKKRHCFNTSWYDGYIQRLKDRLS